jgi:hypothetical protein
MAHFEFLGICTKTSRMNTEIQTLINFAILYFVLKVYQLMIVTCSKQGKQQGFYCPYANKFNEKIGV